MKTIEIEVTLLATTKGYLVEPVKVTGLEDEAVALLALRQAFIAAGKPLAQAAMLKRLPCPSGVKVADWLKGLATKVEWTDFPTVEAVWTEGKAKALEAYNRGSGKANPIEAAAKLLGVPVEALRAMQVK